jgi:hypothetical protein
LYHVPLEGIPGRLSFGPRPRSASELAGVDWLLSLLTPEETRELGLESQVAHRYSIADRHCPGEPASLTTLLVEAQACLNRGGHVHIHCRAGIGRAGMVTACLLMRLGVRDVWDRLQAARGVAVPDTPKQKQWAEDYGRRLNGASNLDEALGRLLS